jgi:hypothetical protein
MNIFVLDYDIEKCAQYHVDKHVVKMILESAQMLSTAVRSTGLDEGYKATHVNHPCNVWLRESIMNWYWLRDLTAELHKEWRFRYNHPETKMHKSFEVVENLTVPKLPVIDMTPFKLCMPDEFKTDDTVESYRKYYLKDKAHLLSWKKRGQPEWA